MEEGKYWWQSTAMRAGLLGLIMGGVQIWCAATGKTLDIEAWRGYVDNTLGLLFGALGIFTGVMALIGRFKAVEPIQKKVIPPLPWPKSDNPTLKE